MFVYNAIDVMPGFCFNVGGIKSIGSSGIEHLALSIIKLILASANSYYANDMGSKKHSIILLC